MTQIPRGFNKRTSTVMMTNKNNCTTADDNDVLLLKTMGMLNITSWPAK